MRASCDIQYLRRRQYIRLDGTVPHEKLRGRMQGTSAQKQTSMSKGHHAYGTVPRFESVGQSYAGGLGLNAGRAGITVPLH